MSQWNTALYTSQSGGEQGQSADVNFPLAKNAAGKIRTAQALYTMTGSEAVNDTIALVVLKAGARVLPNHSKITAQNTALVATMSVGDASDTGRYANGVVLSNTKVDISFASASNGDGTNKYVQSDITVPVPPNTATDQTVVLAKFITTLTTPNAGAQVLISLAWVDE